VGFSIIKHVLDGRSYGCVFATKVLFLIWECIFQSRTIGHFSTCYDIQDLVDLLTPNSSNYIVFWKLTQMSKLLINLN